MYEWVLILWFAAPYKGGAATVDNFINQADCRQAGAQVEQTMRALSSWTCIRKRR
jgi:hypothetical protein